MYENYGAYGADSGGVGGTEVIGTMSLVIMGLILFYIMFMQYKIAHKTGQSDTAWWAFIPIANTFLLLKMAEKPTHWFLFLLIPIANVFFFFKLWIDVARNCGQSGVWGFLVMIPFLNFLALFVLAMSSRPYEYPEDSFPPPSDRPKQPQQVG